MSVAVAQAERIAAIVESPEAKGQEDFARHLARMTDWSVDEALSRLRGEPASAEMIASLHANPPVMTAVVTGFAPPSPHQPVAPTAPAAAPAIALTADRPPVDTGAMWNAVLRSRGLVLEGDAPKTGITPATLTPPAQVAASNPPDWAASLRSRGMKVA